jgi:hypothetical protein
MFNASIINLETGVQVIGTSKNYTMLEDGIEVMGNLAAELTGVEAGTLVPPNIMNAGGSGRTPGSFNGKLLGYGALNLVLGLGSFMQKDWIHGLALLGGYAAAGGLIAWELSLEYEDPLAGVPGTIGLGVAGVTAVYGFIRPFIYEKNRALVNQADRISVLVIPGNRGTVALGLSYTLRF